MKAATNLLLAACTLLLAPCVALGHGARIDYSVNTVTTVEVTIQATYHSGRPMAGAQVTIFAPGQDEQPRFTSICDDQGRFTFRPEAGRVGDWRIHVLREGHGGTITVPVGEHGVEQEVSGTLSSAPHLSTGQVVLMAACVVWGFVGTALFFVRRKR